MGVLAKSSFFRDSERAAIMRLRGLRMMTISLRRNSTCRLSPETVKGKQTVAVKQRGSPKGPRAGQTKCSPLLCASKPTIQYCCACRRGVYHMKDQFIKHDLAFILQEHVQFIFDDMGFILARRQAVTILTPWTHLGHTLLSSTLSWRFCPSRKWLRTPLTTMCTTNPVAVELTTHSEAQAGASSVGASSWPMKP